MTAQLLLEDLSLWTCLWQSIVFAAIGLAGSHLLRHRPARAHPLLLLAMMAAVLVPGASVVVKHLDLGVFAAELAIPEGMGFMATSPGREDSPAISAQRQPSEPAGTEIELMPNEEAAKETRVIPWRLLVLCGWGIASVTLFGRLVVALLAGIWLVRRAQPADCEKIRQATRIAKTRMGVEGEIQVRRSEHVGGPVIWCWARLPILLVPGRAGVQDSRLDWAGVISHELAHWKRHDHVGGLLAELAVCILPWNPLLWWAKKRLASFSEQACDDWVLASGQPDADYAETLLDLEPERQMAFIPTVVGTSNGLSDRVRRILQGRCGNPSVGSGWALVLGIMAILIGVGVAFAQTRSAEPVATTPGQPQPPAPSADKPAADSQKPEQPRYAARTFNSELAFGVSVRETDTGGWRQLGNTPGEVPLQIPACWAWQVYPRAPVKDWSLLARELSENKVPALALDSCTDSDLKHLADLRDLRLLVLFKTSITDAGLEHLKGLTELEILYLGQTWITDAGLAHVRALTGLRGLYLDMTRITDAGLAHLKGLSALRDLSLCGTRITDDGLAHLEGRTGLRNLWLMNTRVTDAGLEHLRGLTGLQSLALNTTRVTGPGLLHLKALTGLEDLSLESGRITDADLTYLDGLPWLKGLELACTQITDAGLTHVRSLTRLQRLSLRRTRITDAGLESLKGLTALRQLELEQTQITGAGLRHLQGLKGLQRLYLNYTQVGDAGLEHLEAMTGLLQLGLQGAQITDAGLEHLQGLTKLQGLYLNRTRITDGGLKHLQGLTELRDLGLTETQVTEAGAGLLKQSLPNLTVRRDQAAPTAQGADKPTEPARADATPVFTDNFDNGPSEKWRFRDAQTTSPGPGYSVENGQLRLSSTRAFLDSIDLANYVVRARVCIKEAVPDAQGSFGIAVRRTPSASRASLQNRYALALICGNPGCLWLAFAHYDGSGALQQQVVGFTSCKVTVGQWYTLEFEVRGEKLRVYLDGKLLVEAKDERLTKGPIQISAGNATVLVDDFSVCRLP